MKVGGIEVRHGAFVDEGATTFALWAPRAESVQLRLVAPRERLVPMTRDDDGWHRVVVEDAGAGARYLFALPDGLEVPDPASRLQADSVHGPSVVLDPAFAWSDGEWPGMTLDGLVLYELHVGTFTAAGTFDAVVGHLDALRDLGVTALSLLPVAQFPGHRNWGYDGVLPFAVQNSYGGPAGLQRLVDACHARGMAVVIDVVHNHVGPEGNYLARLGPYFTTTYRTPWGEALNFDGKGSDEVRRFFVESALWLLDACHVDGLRLDAVHAIRDHSARPFLQELSADVDALSGATRRPRLLIAESNLNDVRLLRPREGGGMGLHAQWSDDFHHALHAIATGERARYYVDFGALDQIAGAYSAGWLFQGQHSRYRGRRHGNAPDGVDARRFVVFTQNHDQVGNRPRGDRLGAPGDLALQRALAVALVLAPFTPMLFMGQEYGERAPFHYFVDHGDEDLVAAVRHGRREEFEGFGWPIEHLPDPGAPRAFEESRLDHSLAQQPAHRGLRALYRELLRLRREHPALRGGTEGIDAEARGNVVVVRRRHGGDELLFAFALAAGGELAVPPGFEVLLDTQSPRWRGEDDPAAADGAGAVPARQTRRGGDGTLQLPAKSAIVLVRSTSVR